MKKTIVLAYAIVCAILLSSCQKAVIGDSYDESSDGPANVTFNIRQFEQIPFSSAKGTRAKALKDVCSKINLAVYSGSDVVKSSSQKSTDSNFGKLSLALDEGSYQVVIVANKKGNSATMSNLEQIKFTGGVSDTFFWSQEINVDDDQKQAIDVDMKRNVAMVRFVTTDSVPQNLASLKFYSKGGSSSFNGYTGRGYEKSTSQTTNVSITSDMKGKPATFEIFTFPKEEDDNFLKIEVTGMDSGKNTLFKRTFENVSIARNMITIFKGDLFLMPDPAKDDNASFNVTTDEDWDTVETTF